MRIGEAVRERILALCAERGITVNKLGTMSGVTQSTINNITSGRNNSATVATIKKLCDGLDISSPSQSFLIVATVALLLRPLVMLFIVDCVTPLIVPSLFTVIPRSAHSASILSRTASPILNALILT